MPCNDPKHGPHGAAVQSREKSKMGTWYENLPESLRRESEKLNRGDAVIARVVEVGSFQIRDEDFRVGKPRVYVILEYPDGSRRELTYDEVIEAEALGKLKVIPKNN
jgi:hypothetical protein